MRSPIEVRRSGIHGRGVYATRFIAKGKRIIEYTGERIPDENIDDDDESSHTFYFALSNGKVIDPAVKDGNDARWINHSCEPNCEAIEERNRVFIYALRDIQSGEELFYDYSLQVDGRVTRKEKKQYECLCGEDNCRGTMLDLEQKADG